MLEYAKQYPGYHFEKHKATAPKCMLEALREFGPCPIHRKTFLKKILAEEVCACQTPVPAASASS